MGCRKIILKLPTDFAEIALKDRIKKELGINEFSYQIESKSLDARNKRNIFWLVRVVISSPELKGGEAVLHPELKIPFRKTREKVVITGSGPAGFFAARILQKAGFNTILLERGKEVGSREESIRQFEKNGNFDPRGNYSFGEGGAGTFSDGKLTSRSKHIAEIKRFIIESYIHAGGPPEIAYMAHPHLGSDNLKTIVRNLRKDHENSGGMIYFETMLEDLEIEDGIVHTARTDKGDIEADHFIMATGHSAFETYRMLMKRGVRFRPKNFAIGSRVEHPQRLINLAQWGREDLPGIRAAEYRLTFNPPGKASVYTFCMCPGGIVVPATAYSNTSIVNGMSFYRRDLKFANAACVSAVNPEEYFGRIPEAGEVLYWLENLEMKFLSYTGDFRIPFCGIKDFIERKNPDMIVETSYPLGLTPAALWELLPEKAADSIREGLKSFCRKIKGFDKGIIMGLESKTSAPLQVLRDVKGRCDGFKNLYMAGEGSGYAGGIISSGADGIKTAINLLNNSAVN